MDFKDCRYIVQQYDIFEGWVPSTGWHDRDKDCAIKECIRRIDEAIQIKKKDWRVLDTLTGRVLSHTLPPLSEGFTN